LKPSLDLAPLHLVRRARLLDHFFERCGILGWRSMGCGKPEEPVVLGAVGQQTAEVTLPCERFRKSSHWARGRAITYTYPCKFRNGDTLAIREPEIGGIDLARQMTTRSASKSDRLGML
jgi:hypothetical protein